MVKISSKATKRIKKIKKNNKSLLRRYFSLLYPMDYVVKLVPDEL